MTRRAPHGRSGAPEEGLAAWYHRVVKHAAFEQLDKAFPELAPVANAEGWSARRSCGAAQSRRNGSSRLMRYARACFSPMAGAWTGSTT